MPDKYKKDLSIEIVVGLFMFMILIALGVFTIVLSRQNFLQEKYPVRITFSEVGGLREGDHVFLRGTKIGVVKATFLENHHVIVTSDLETPVDFREGYKVEVISSSMLGGKILRIYEGPLTAASLPEDDEIFGEKPVDILDELSVAVTGIREVSDQLASGEGTAGRLLKDEEIYEQMAEMVKNLNEVSARMVAGDGTLGKLLSKDDQIYKDIQDSVATMRDVTTRIEQGEGTLGKLLSEDETVYADIQTSVTSIRDVTKKMSSGEGTLGRLIEDDQMYVEAQKLLEEFRAALDDLRETSPVTTFSGVVFGAF